MGLQESKLKIVFDGGKAFIKGPTPDGKEAVFIAEVKGDSEVEVSICSDECTREIISVVEFLENLRDLGEEKTLRDIFDNEETNTLVAMLIEQIQFFLENYLGRSLSDLSLT